MSLQSGHQEVHVYEAESAIRDPLKVLRTIFRDLAESRELAVTLAVRDLTAQYRQSMLGIIWAILPPLFFAVGLTVLRANNIVSIKGSAHIPYPAFVLISMTLWTIFMTSLEGPIRALSTSRGILTRVNFPRETIVASNIIKMSFDISIRLVIIVATFLIFRIPLRSTILLFPFALLNLVLLGTMFGIFLAPVGLLYRDIGNALPMVGYAWMAVTPVLMTIDDLAPGGLYAAVVRLNPVTPLLAGARELLVGLPVENLGMYAVWTVASLAGLLIALIYFRVSMPMVIERWSS